MARKHGHSSTSSSSKSTRGEVTAGESKAKTAEEIQRKLRSVPARKDRVNESLTALQDFTDAGGTLFQSRNRGRVTALNQNLMKNCTEEADYLRKLLSDIEKLKAIKLREKQAVPMSRAQMLQFIGNQGAVLPLWIQGVDGFPPPSVGAIQLPINSPLKIGDSVAALSGEDWVLAEVDTALPGGKFSLKDVDDPERSDLVLPRSCIIPLPKYRADPQRDGHALFPLDAIVLALYPQTTCFYRGIVQAPPEKATDPYSIIFEDPSYPSGYSPPLQIHQRYVISYRDPPDKKDRNID